MAKRKKHSSEYRFQKDTSFLKCYEKQFILIVVIIGAIRVFIFNAAFPFFNNVDEDSHYDTVVKYARGYLPQKQQVFFDYESVSNAILYGSPEYHFTSSKFQDNKIPPPMWRVLPIYPPGVFEQIVSKEMQSVNSEVFSPPLYYVAAGVWYDIGKWIGMRGGFAMYWIRFINVVVIVLLLLLTNKFCKLVVPENNSLRFSVIILLAFYPQDTFYSITNDAFSPLFFLLSLILLWEISQSNKKSSFYFLTGLLIAASLLVKTTNIVLFGIMLLVLGKKLYEYRYKQKFKKELLQAAICLTGIVIPIAIWTTINGIYSGDPLGASIKVERWGWTLKPFYQWFDHPIFSIQGMSFFTAELIRTFWRGEFIWGSQRIASAVADNIYLVSTIICLLVSVLSLFIRRSLTWSMNRYHYMLLSLSIVGSVLMLGVLSLMYDYGNCIYPSRNSPYFTSGRLMLGVLVPFLILFVYGLQSLLIFLRSRINVIWIILVFIFFITISEISISIPVFLSQYNYFHLF